MSSMVSLASTYVTKPHSSDCRTTSQGGAKTVSTQRCMSTSAKAGGGWAEAAGGGWAEAAGGRAEAVACVSTSAEAAGRFKVFGAMVKCPRKP